MKISTSALQFFVEADHVQGQVRWNQTKTRRKTTAVSEDAELNFQVEAV